MPNNSNDIPRCHQCGSAFTRTSAGINGHVDEYGDLDWELDAQHAPFELDGEALSQATDHKTAKARANIKQLCDMVNALDRKSGGNGRKVRVEDFTDCLSDC